MAGLLKQLQKAKPGFKASTDEVLLTQRKNLLPTGVANVNASDESVEEASKSRVAAGMQEAEQLLSELVEESARSIKAANVVGTSSPAIAQDEIERSPSASSALKFIRKKRKSSSGALVVKNSREELAWWQANKKSNSPQVEVLVPQARKMLNEILPSDGNIEIDLKTAVRRAVEVASQMLSEEMRITEADRENAFEELFSLLAGKGPLQPLYDDEGITDIFIDNHSSIKVIRKGQAIETPFSFRNAGEYKAYVNAMLQSVDRVLNISSPIVDCALDDNWRSRVSAIDPSILDGDEPRVCIRIPRLQKISFYDILNTKTLPATLAAWLAELVVSGEANILVLGPTGSGKTVMTTAILSAVGADERIITIEDVPEIFVPTAHLEKLVSRPANAQGQGEVKMPELLKAALRRAPHRIVVGEIRDEEGRLFLRALETGHAGSIATIHADSSSDSLWRLLDVVAAYESAPQESIMRRIARSLHITIRMGKVDGRPCLMEVAEVLPPEGFDFRVRPLVKYEGMKGGKRSWRMMTKDSYWLKRIAERGVELRAGPGLLSPEDKLPEREASQAGA